MKIKAKQLLTTFFIGIICLLLGVYIGKYFATENTKLIFDMMSLDESHDLLKSAYILEALHNDKIQKTIDILHVEIKTQLSVYDDNYYANLPLSDETLTTIRANRQGANDVLKRYPNARIKEIK